MITIIEQSSVECVNRVYKCELIQAESESLHNLLFITSEFYPDDPIAIKVPGLEIPTISAINPLPQDPRYRSRAEMG